jgi:hypothetical protein
VGRRQWAGGRVSTGRLEVGGLEVSAPLEGGLVRMGDDWKHKIFERDGYQCVYCGWDGSHELRAYMLLEPDHFIPLEKGGSPDADNVVTSCHLCNNMKGRQIFKSIEDAKREIEKYYENVKRDWHQKMSSLLGTSSASLP